MSERFNTPSRHFSEKGQKEEGSDPGGPWARAYGSFIVTQPVGF
jgi:hypothetical protein